MNMNEKEIIAHPDAFHLITISHGGVASIVNDLTEGGTHLIAVDGSHERYSKIYVLDKEDTESK